MERLYYDLHMHSCLSPCGDDDMTPGNICGMASLAGLQCVALTDHNSCRNARSFLALAENFGLLAVPGMELCTREEVHVVCLFAEIDGAEAFSDYVYARMPPIQNRPDIFGHQLLRDANDEVVGEEPRLLLSAADIGLYDVPALVSRYNGLAFPAHIDRDSFSLLANLGIWDETMGFSFAERTAKANTAKLPHLPYLINSDAHRLDAIPDAVRWLDIPRRSAAAVLETLGKLAIDG